MKRKLKIALMSLVLIPCLLLLSACSASTSKYADKLATASEKYFFNHGSVHQKDLTITTKSEGKRTYNESVQYNESASRTESFEEVSESTETIEIDAVQNEENTYINYIRITRSYKNTLDGFKANEAKTGLEAFTKVTENNSVYTLVKDNETYKCYVDIQVKVDGVVDETATKKSVYSFNDLVEYSTYVKTLTNTINDKLIVSTFYDSFDNYKLLGAEVNRYTNFGKFGTKVEYSGMELDVDNDLDMYEYAFNHGTMKFKNTLKKSGPVKATYELESYDFGSLSDVSKINTKVEKELKVSYKDVSISVPTGFEDIAAVDGNPSISFSRFLSID